MPRHTPSHTVHLRGVRVLTEQCTRCAMPAVVPGDWRTASSVGVGRHFPWKKRLLRSSSKIAHLQAGLLAHVLRDGEWGLTTHYVGGGHSSNCRAFRPLQHGGVQPWLPTRPDFLWWGETHHRVNFLCSVSFLQSSHVPSNHQQRPVCTTTAIFLPLGDFHCQPLILRP